MTEIQISNHELENNKVRILSTIDDRNYHIDRLLSDNKLINSRKKTDIKRTFVKSYTYQKTLEETINKNAPQFKDHSKLYSLNAASSIALDDISAENYKEEGVVNHLVKNRELNLEAQLPNPVTKTMKLYFDTLFESNKYDLNPESSTIEFFKWMRESTEELLKNDKYIGLDNFLQQNPISIGNRKFNRIGKIDFEKISINNYSTTLGWDMIGGYEEQKKQLINISKRISNLDSVSKYHKNPIPRGILLLGPSGTAKTTLAEIFATQSGLPFEKIKAAQMGSPYVNESGDRWQKKFDDLAKKIEKGGAPGAILIVDEIEAVCPNRNNTGSREDSKVTNVFLENMDGSHYVPGRMVIGASNMAHLIDSAILSRFRPIELSFPDQDQREKIISAILDDYQSYASSCDYLQGNFYDNINLSRLAKISNNFTGRNIRDAIERQIDFNTDHHIETGEKIPPISTESLIKHFTEYENENKFKIIKNLNDYHKSTQYMAKLND